MEIVFANVDEVEPARSLALIDTCTGLLTAIATLMRGVSGDDLCVDSPVSAVVFALNRVFVVDHDTVATCQARLQRRVLTAAIADVHECAWAAVSALIESHKDILLPISSSIFTAAHKVDG
ncbi:hypothetical protein PTSG_11013 [Salpingoeca rosetta]|uniref:Uncharacterized protein n=1 Tax=Salpingoeca rosetta (strain ATCC 50818 / BSB-021) TaxID=946362 RepID=F2USF9_SALR5|nr:uncharacterized protein PTSG_11013 [Salpingoeca rosetta]EGD81068.1 hypothetical protein PTSG_11013 [Salpingoeca rosetta]|eukprot:XP_004987937.1 hypothetical protein PTSG_11013 [Salpingoeca rosetta]